MHGILNNKHKMRFAEAALHEMYPDTYILNMEIGGGILDSVLIPLNDQVEEFAMNVKNDKRLSQGFVALCHSQGSIVCRGYL